MIQYFEWNLPNDGELWQKLMCDAVHLRRAGITAVWIPPAYKASEQGNPGYAAYDLYDLGEFDQKGAVRTKYGTKEELIAMIDELHSHEISVYLDVVMNHKIGADYTENFQACEVDPEDRTKELSEPYEIESWTGFDFPARAGKYSDFKWHFFHFCGLEMDDPDRGKILYRITGEDKQWSDDVDKENGNFDFLMGTDADLRHPEVVSELNKWGAWVARELHLDGMRLDAIKHMSRAFVAQFVAQIRAEQGSDFYVVGEYWKADLAVLEDYLTGVNNAIDLFDVPLHYHFHQASLLGEEYDLRGLYEGVLVSTHPELAVTFVDNHDSQKGSSLESEVEEWFKPLAYGLILLRKEGYPCVFYGDYYGVCGQESPLRNLLFILLECRSRYAYGEEKLFMNDPNLFVVFRAGDFEHPSSGLVLLLSNAEDKCIEINVGKERAGETWREITGNRNEEVLIDIHGNAEFFVSGRNLAVWGKSE